jgi:NAD(P)-dependent dehydrogenase (short-subunit alcohol dehydrogenase family)
VINFGGRRIVVVGGGMGIGLAAALILDGLGARVAVADRDPESEARLPTGVSFTACDATDPTSVDAMLDDASARLGGIDGLFTTVGGAALGLLNAMDLDAWDREIRFNLGSAFVVGKAALPHLEKAGGGAIVTTSSGYAIMAGTDRAAYTAAKAGVIAFSRSLSMIAAPMGIRVNCIAPGPTDTPRFRAMNGGDEGVERVRKSMPLGVIPTPADCARLAVFLLSDAASQITGQTVHVSGGLLLP